ncbi:MAG: L-lactate dehydrogenase [Eubacteriales bacterium]
MATAPNKRKCAVIGCGNVGASIAYTYTMSGLFSEMVLIDLNRAKAEGEAMDLSHGLPFLSPMKIYAGGYADLTDAFLIIIAAGANQKEGETRLQLLSTNLKIFASIVRQIKQYTTSAILLVVTNPVDVLTYYTMRVSGYPPEKVIGSGTVLDTARLKQLLGNYLSVDSRNIHAFIIGEHGDSELAVWSSANISGIDLDDYFRITGACNDNECLQDMFADVRDAAYRIIAGKGATYYAIAQAVMRITQSILRDENTVMPVSTLLHGEYGISDVCLGVPAVVGVTGVKRVLEIPLDENELQKLRKSAQTVKQELADCHASFV